jgi:hypothetical protein
MANKESKKIRRKEIMAKKLECLESEILKRLKDTHMRQQNAIEEIEKIFKNQSTSQSTHVTNKGSL